MSEQNNIYCILCNSELSDIDYQAFKKDIITLEKKYMTVCSKLPKSGMDRLQKISNKYIKDIPIYMVIKHWSDHENYCEPKKTKVQEWKTIAEKVEKMLKIPDSN